MSRKKNDLYSVRRSNIGRGLFAQKLILKGTKVVEYTGKKIPTKIADKLTTRYLFDLENGWTIDGATYTNIARYVNHSCAPNCEAVLENGKIFYYASRNIKPNEEITVDYDEEYFDEFIKPFGCKCAPCLKKKKPLAYASGLSV